MPQLTLSLVGADGAVRGTATGESLVQLDTRYAEYQPGDVLVLTADEKNLELEVMLDESLPPSVVYLTDGRLEFPIPFEAARDPYPSHAFLGDTHWGYARVLDPRERATWRDLALNSHDLEGATGTYPHATTNSGATNPRFIARNAIDGTWQSIHHGRWPYESWGINGRDDAWLQVDFGHPVHAEEAVLVLRADFPHDTWWQQATITCSDGYEAAVHLEKSGLPQRFSLGEGGRDIEWIRLSNLVKADDPAEFPALSQLIVMGTLD